MFGNLIWYRSDNAGYETARLQVNFLEKDWKSKLQMWFGRGFNEVKFIFRWNPIDNAGFMIEPFEYVQFDWRLMNDSLKFCW